MSVIMTWEEFSKHMDNDLIVRQTYIVRIRKRYTPDDEWDYSNEIYYWEWETNSWTWYNDWYEGQAYVEILGCMELDDVDIENIFPEG